jgi:SAM-dependent methyltransferase
MKPQHQKSSDISQNSMNDASGFAQTYKRFEDKFRGSREEVLLRLSAYDPLLNLALATHGQHAKVLDLGSGRGEWLSKLAGMGFDGTGVDSNQAMNAEAQRHNIKCEAQDALEYLRNCPAEHFSVVSAFHFVEHIPTDYLLAVLRESFRVLKKGGLLILETPNPENLRVSQWSFYLDPSHQRPIPPPLLDFFVEDAGFVSHYLLRVNGVSQKNGASTLEQTLGRMLKASPDYASIGLKEAAPDMVEHCERFIQLTSQVRPDDEQEIATAGQQQDNRIKVVEIESKQLHATIDHWGQRWDQRWDQHWVKLEAQLDSLQIAQVLTARNNELENQNRVAAQNLAQIQTHTALQERQIHELGMQLQAHHQASSGQIDALKAEIAALRSSTSWKVTEPLRNLSQFLASITRPSIEILKLPAAAAVSCIIWLAIKLPPVKRLLLSMLHVFPTLQRHLRLFAKARGFNVYVPEPAQPTPATIIVPTPVSAPAPEPEKTLITKPPTTFEDLTSIRVMTAAGRSVLNIESSSNVTFLDVPPHDRK